MRNIVLIIIAFLLSNQLVESQTFTHEFGKYSNEEFQMKTYSKDINAEAVVIYDIGKSYFRLIENGFELFFERRVKIKILSKAGIDWAQIEIPFYEENNKAEEILELIGNTYNYEDGLIRCTKLDPKNTYVEKLKNNWKVKKFAMPDVKEGSVIEVKYTVSSPYLFNFRSWDFQSEIPVIYSEYTTLMIPFYTYTYILQGSNKLNDLKKYTDSGTRQFAGYTWQDVVYVFTMKDIPAFKDETFISAPEDYMIKLDFQLSEYINSIGTKEEIMTTWPKLIKEMLDDPLFGGYVKTSQSKANDIVDTMSLALKSTQEKAETILKYVKSNYNWNGTFSKQSSKSVKEFLKSKVGNSADINLFLVGMLKSSGVEAYPVLISTRGHGTIKLDYPFHHFFNYVIAAVKTDSLVFTLDATEPLCSYKMLPKRCLNDKGLVIKKVKDNVEWISFSSTANSSSIYNIELTPNIEEDSIKGRIKISSSGYNALELRKQYYKSSSDFKDDVLSNNLVLVDSIKVDQLTQVDKPLIIDFRANSGIDAIDGKILISPFYGFAISDNPLKQPGRLYPIDMAYKKQNSFFTTIHIPEGYKLLKVPEALSIDNDDVKISYLLDNDSNGLVKVIGVYEFKKDIYKTTSYIDLKFYFKKIIDKFNEKLIFVKV